MQPYQEIRFTVDETHGRQELLHLVETDADLVEKEADLGSTKAHFASIHTIIHPEKSTIFLQFHLFDKKNQLIQSLKCDCPLLSEFFRMFYDNAAIDIKMLEKFPDSRDARFFCSESKFY